MTEGTLPRTGPVREGSLRGLVPGVGHTVKSRLNAASAHSKVEALVLGIDHQVCQGQGRSREELLELCLVGGPLGFQVYGIELTIAPVTDVEGLLVLGREFGTIAKADAGGRAWTDVYHGRQAVGIVDGPLAGSIAPAKFSPADHVAHAGGAVPGRVQIPFHVGVKSEQLALAIEGGIVFIAKTRGDDLPVLAIRVSLGNPAPRRENALHEATTIDPRQQLVLLPDRWHPGNIILRQCRLIAHHHINRFALGPQHHGVRSMFPSLLLKFFEQRDLIKLVIASGIFQTVEATPTVFLAIDCGVETVEGIQQALTMAHVYLQFLHLGASLVAWRWHGHPIQRAVLVGDNQASPVIHTHADPRTLLFLGHRVDQFHIEAFFDVHVRRRRGL